MGHFTSVSFAKSCGILQSRSVVLDYLDDITLGDDAAVCLEDFLRLKAASEKLGLTLNRSKCEVIGHNDVSRALFSARGVSLPETSKSAAILLKTMLY